MNLPLASLDPVIATLILSVFVLIAGVALVFKALDSNNLDASKQTFAVVGVLFGLLAAGGLGGLFANQAAETVASSAKTAGTAAATEVSDEVSELSKQVEKAIPTPSKGNKK
jgi:hypothetical protein